MTQDCKDVALKLPKVSLSKGNLGKFKGYTFFVREMLEGLLLPRVEVATKALQSF